MWKNTIRVITVLSWLVSTGWLFFDPGFEQLLAFLGCTSALLIAFPLKLPQKQIRLFNSPIGSEIYKYTKFRNVSKGELKESREFVDKEVLRLATGLEREYQKLLVVKNISHKIFYPMLIPAFIYSSQHGDAITFGIKFFSSSESITFVALIVTAFVVANGPFVYKTSKLIENINKVTSEIGRAIQTLGGVDVDLQLVAEVFIGLLADRDSITSEGDVIEFYNQLHVHITPKELRSAIQRYLSNPQNRNKLRKQFKHNKALLDSLTDRYCNGKDTSN